MRRFLVVASAALCWGCFVFDELDQGEKVMEQLGPGKNAARKQQPAPAVRETEPAKPSGPGALERLQAWWDQATAPEPVRRDPSDVIVRCRIDGSAQFMRKSDCQLRGGQV